MLVEISIFVMNEVFVEIVMNLLGVLVSGTLLFAYSLCFLGARFTECKRGEGEVDRDF